MSGEKSQTWEALLPPDWQQPLLIPHSPLKCPEASSFTSLGTSTITIPTSPYMRMFSFLHRVISCERNYVVWIYESVTDSLHWLNRGLNQELEERGKSNCSWNSSSNRSKQGRGGGGRGRVTVGDEVATKNLFNLQNPPDSKWINFN